MPQGRVPGPEGVEALLARTKRQITRTIFAATALVVFVVGVGGALASSSALDRGLEIGIIENDKRCIAAQLHRNFLYCL